MTSSRREIDDARRVAQIYDLLKIPAETEWVEFKQNNVDPERMGRTVSALSNSARLSDQPFGYMIWGIEDDSKRIVGTSFIPVTAARGGQPLELWLRNSLKPDVDVQFFEVQMPSHKVVLLQIPAAVTVPTKFNNIAYVRIQSATPKLADHSDREASLLSKLRPFAWETGVALTYVPGDNVIDLLDYTSYFRLAKRPQPTTKRQIIDTLLHAGVIERDVGGRWNITNLGGLLFANRLADFPSARRKAVRFIRYDGTSRVRTRSEKDGEKGYAPGFQGLIDFIDAALPRNEFIEKAIRQERAIFPNEAVREIVANALIHQDLTITGTGPMIELFDDRMEVTSPGHPLIPTDRFIDLPPRSRNENIASLMRQMHICEERGSGVDKIVTFCEVFQLPAPDFRTVGEHTKAIIYAPRPFRDMDQQERIRACYQHTVLRYLTNQRATNASLRERFGIEERNAAMVSRVINDTVAAELIRPSDTWNARTGSYLPFWA